MQGSILLDAITRMINVLLHRPLLIERRSNLSYLRCSGCELLLSKILAVPRLVTGYILVPQTPTMYFQVFSSPLEHVSGLL